jgi:predicted small lipoprotein YifL
MKALVTPRTATLLMIASVCALLAACGQKGPLYLPDKTGTVITRPAPSADPPASEAPTAPSTTPTPDSSPPAPPPAPETGAPEDEAAKKNKNTAPTPPGN